MEIRACQLDRSTGWQLVRRHGGVLSIAGGNYDHFMAQKIQMLFIDDLDGGEAAGTVRFGLDGTEYEIDLSAAHGEALRTALERYIRHARRAGGTARRAARNSRANSAVDTAKV